MAPLPSGVCENCSVCRSQPRVIATTVEVASACSISTVAALMIPRASRRRPSQDSAKHKRERSAIDALSSCSSTGVNSSKRRERERETPPALRFLNPAAWFGFAYSIMARLSRDEAAGSRSPSPSGQRFWALWPLAAPRFAAQVLNAD